MEGETVGYEAEVKRALRLMRKAKVQYMITGALASGYYGLPRSTADLDLVVKPGKSDIGRLVGAARKAGFEVDEREVLTGVEIGNRIVMQSSETFRVDLWLPRSEYDEIALSRRCRKRIFNELAYICSPEDLILQKLRAGRRQDEDDVVGVLIRQSGKLDERYLSTWASSLGVERALKRVMERVKRGE